MHGVSESTIQEIKTIIRDRFKPERIILFGSQATGKAGSHSDVDLLVIMHTALKFPRQAAQIHMLLPPEIPIDILVRTPEALKKRLNMGDPFFKTILEEGQVLYEKHNTGMD